MNENTTIYTVSQLSRKIKTLLEKEFRFVRISGEVSNLRTPSSGHSYFTLKDSSAQLQAVLFSGKKRFLDTELKDGQEVVCFGQIGVYEPRGSYQLIVDSVEPAGEGRLRRQFEQLKIRLAEKKYFALERKKTIPTQPQRIAVVTSPTSAAFADFRKIFAVRQSSVHIQVYPVRVQGKEAIAEIIEAIEKIDNLQQHDVIVLIRGGGSLEDLWAFNEESVADAIFRATLPIVTGIGHEIDYTIADFCADYRCPTPTAVAEFLAQDRVVQYRRLQGALQHFRSLMQLTIIRAKQRLSPALQKLTAFEYRITSATQRIEISRSQLIEAVDACITSKVIEVERLREKLYLLSPSAKIIYRQSRMAELRRRLEAAMRYNLEKQEEKLQRHSALLHSVSPLATLGRGYAIVHPKDGISVIKNAQDIEKGAQINVRLHQGKLVCVVEEVQKTFSP